MEGKIKNEYIHNTCTCLLPSLIFAMSTLALFNCNAVWRAGRSWRRSVGSWRSGVAGDWITGETGTVEVDDPGGPDAVFKLPEPDDEDWDWVPREAAGLSTWADSESKRREKVNRHSFFPQITWVKKMSDLASVLIYIWWYFNETF